MFYKSIYIALTDVLMDISICETSGWICILTNALCSLWVFKKINLWNVSGANSIVLLPHELVECDEVIAADCRHKEVRRGPAELHDTDPTICVTHDQYSLVGIVGVKPASICIM